MSGARPTWRGFLKISLVTIPIKVFPATETSTAIGFNQLHGECQTRIQQKRWCPHCKKEVASSEIVKGHEFAPGKFVVLDDTDFDQVHTPSTRVIDLAQFSKADALDPMYIDRTYYLAPDGDMAAEAYAVMREGLRGYVGIGKLALYGREYLVAVRAVARTITLHTLHHAAELRSIDAVTELRTVPAIAAADQVALARQVVAAFSGPLDLATFRDAYHDQLQTIIDAKIAGKEITTAPAAASPHVVNLSEALKQSLATMSRAKKTPAKAAATKKRRAS